MTANSAAKTYGQTLSFAATDFSSSGLVNGDTIGSVTEISTGAVATAGVAGSPYAITPSNAAGGSFVPSNYTIGYVDGVLTVNPASDSGGDAEVPALVVAPLPASSGGTEAPVVVITQPFTAAGSLVSGVNVTQTNPSVASRDLRGKTPVEVGLVAFAPAGLNLTVVGNGVRMPLYLVADTLPIQPGQDNVSVQTQIVQPVPITLPVATLPARLTPTISLRDAEPGTYTPPHYPRKQDRH